VVLCIKIQTVQDLGQSDYLVQYAKNTESLDRLDKDNGAFALVLFIDEVTFHASG
jgi:hypothetical protein